MPSFSGKEPSETFESLAAAVMGALHAGAHLRPDPAWSAGACAQALGALLALASTEVRFSGFSSVPAVDAIEAAWPRLVELATPRIARGDEAHRAAALAALAALSSLWAVGVLALRTREAAHADFDRRGSAPAS